MINEITQNDLDLHAKWLRSEDGGVRLVTAVGLITISANLSGANLRRADLIDAYLNGANLSRADLNGANLSRADLNDANLSGAYLNGANLSGANLIGANLSRANLNDANLSGADLNDANLSGANLIGANLIGANLSDANLSDANLSRAKNLLNPVIWLDDNFEHDDLGYIVYKAIGNTNYYAPDYWKIEAGSTIEEVVNPLPTVNCGCGVNFATLKLVKDNHANSTIWRCRIRWEWLPGVVVPYNTDGKARCSKLELVEII